jgi:hypothetical protein
MRTMSHDAREPESDVAGSIEDALDAEWNEAFAWGYGRRLWNVGCG